MIHLYTGEGKGKTTAAIGQAVRAAGAGYPVIFSQFMKGNDSSELSVLKELSNVTILKNSKRFGFYHTLTEEDKQQLFDIHNEILEELLAAARERRCRMMVLDEITYPVSWRLLDAAKLKALIAYGNDGLELILTGRNAAEFLLDAADYITEMKCVRHPYEKGIPARKGIEF